MDRRVTPARGDVAAAHLRGLVQADEYRDGQVLTVQAPAAPLRRGPAADAAIETELLLGERFVVYDRAGDWSWGQAVRDDYVGYAPTALLSPQTKAPNAAVRAAMTCVYAEPDAKSAPRALLSMNAQVAIDGPEVAGFSPLAGGGFAPAAHLSALDAFEPDYVAVAERFLGAPYVWGGRQAIGIDCSGLVQAALFRAGRSCPRDSDQQHSALGGEVAAEARRRGDLVFWKGHVAILRDPETIVHANGARMQVSFDSVTAFAERVRDEAGPILAYIRPDMG